jgi:hypothetical protein
MSLQDTYHITLGKKRTTVSLDTILSVILALKLGTEPGTEEAHSAVRKFLQDMLDQHNDPKRRYVSQWLRTQLVLEIMDKKISEIYWKWFDRVHLKRR